MGTPSDHDAIRKAVEKRCAAQGFCSADEIEADTGIDRRQVHDALNHLIHGKQVQRLKRGRYGLISTPAAPAASSPGSGPVWSKSLPRYEHGYVRYDPQGDALFVAFETDPLALEVIDPSLSLLVLKSDPGRLVGFTVQPYGEILRRFGLGPLAFRGPQATVDEILALTLAGIVLAMREKGELAAPAGRRRLAALQENVLALSRRIGERQLGYYAERQRQELLRTS